MSNQITEHFTWLEATWSTTAHKRGLDNTPNEKVKQNIKAAACGMEKVREILDGKPITIYPNHSWYRSTAVNKAVGGSPTSSHRDGYAVDFTCPQFGDITAICRAIARSDLRFDQLIWEGPEGSSWVHISFDPRNRGETLIYDGHSYVYGVP